MTLKVIRDGDERSCTAKLGDLPMGTLTKAGGEGGRGRGEGGQHVALRGAAVADLGAWARRQHATPSGMEGVVITSVGTDSAAGEAGLRPGGAIVEGNRRHVTNANDGLEFSRQNKGARLC